MSDPAICDEASMSAAEKTAKARKPRPHEQHKPRPAQTWEGTLEVDRGPVRADQARAWREFWDEQYARMKSAGR